MLGGDFEIIPTPGHTPGATAFLWNRHLFTGDTVFLRDGEWAVAVLEDSDPDAYVESLELMKTLDFDTLVPWAASGPYYGRRLGRARAPRHADQNNPRAAHSARGEPCGRSFPVTSARRGSRRPATTSTQSS